MEYIKKVSFILLVSAIGFTWGMASQQRSTTEAMSLAAQYQEMANECQIQRLETLVDTARRTIKRHEIYEVGK